MQSRYALFLLAFLLALPARAQTTTFDVVVQPKSPDHPNTGQGHPSAYVIDGEEANELTLVRGMTYVFEVGAGAATHPFYISTSEAGGGAGEYTDGVTGSGATTGETLTFVVPEGAPDLLYYQCQFHTFMGWRINVIDNTTDTEDAVQPLALALDVPFPNPFAGTTRLGVTLEAAQQARVAVFDLAGRRVRVLHDGALAAGTTHFDLAAEGLAAGTYLVRVTAEAGMREQRVTVVR